MHLKHSVTYSEKETLYNMSLPSTFSVVKETVYFRDCKSRDEDCNSSLHIRLFGSTHKAIIVFESPVTII